MIKLYGAPATRAMRCLIALEELGVEYENLPVRGPSIKELEYLKLNPNGKVPTLEDDGFVLWESLAINLYLARKYDGGLWPKSDADQALALQWTFWLASEIEPRLIVLIRSRMMKPGDPEQGDATEAELQAPLSVLDAALAGKPYLLGPSFSVVDLNLASSMSWVSYAQLDLARFPNLQRWLGECMERPAFKKILATATAAMAAR